MDKSAEPVQEDNTKQTIIVPPLPLPWYRRILNKFRTNKNIGIYLGGLILLITGYIISQATLHQQGLPIRAGTNTVRISIQPATNSMPPKTIFQIWATANNPVAFVTIKIVFDPTVVNLTGEVSTGPSPLTRVIKKTSMNEANTTGIINLTLALDPAKRSSPPRGTFEVATLPMAPNTNQNVITTLHMDASVMQVVNPDSTIFTITTIDSTLTLNPPPPTATPTATPTPTAAATATPRASHTPTPTPAIPPLKRNNR